MRWNAVQVCVIGLTLSTGCVEATTPSQAKPDLPSGCGNGELAAGSEMCDGQAMGREDCGSATAGNMKGGSLGCHDNCTLDMSECEPDGDVAGVYDDLEGPGQTERSEAPCGNGRIDPGEMCDGTFLAGQTCSTATDGMITLGTLSCADNCTLDMSACRPEPVCGNGVVEGDEECDGDLGAQTCASVTVGALPYGVLGCDAECKLDVSECATTDDTSGNGGTGGGGTGGGGTGG
ncbi:MAG: hypothetical protein OXU20_14600 [Myxococcales bacterium]|nr:hypothetical protein [Myxococcales bacterium]